MTSWECSQLRTCWRSGVTNSWRGPKKWLEGTSSRNWLLKNGGTVVFGQFFFGGWASQVQRASSKAHSKSTVRFGLSRLFSFTLGQTWWGWNPWRIKNRFSRNRSYAQRRPGTNMTWLCGICRWWMIHLWIPTVKTRNTSDFYGHGVIIQ